MDVPQIVEEHTADIVIQEGKAQFGGIEQVRACPRALDQLPGGTGKLRRIEHEGEPNGSSYIHPLGVRNEDANRKCFMVDVVSQVFDHPVEWSRLPSATPWTLEQGIASEVTSPRLDPLVWVGNGTACALDTIC